MRIAVASGKGGTGKTTVATNLAYLAAQAGRTVVYADCDVEEPNGHLFLKPTIERESSIDRLLPVVDHQRCTLCGRCSEVCRFSAIACVGQSVLVFGELCHSCGGCQLACPEQAIGEAPHSVGRLRLGASGSVRFVDGMLNVGEAMSPPAIRAVKAALPTDADLAILDCPPGTSCPVIESVRGADLLLLVTEPTPFGLNDLGLAVEMARALRLPFGIVVNRADAGDREVWEYCRRQGIAILAEIPDDRAVAEAYSRGELAAVAVPRFQERVAGLLAKVSSDRLLENRGVA
ncbi:MAG: P-loop NTPase [Candidatus Anammoximicrobium sp.]|nr:P-loop NTPase [Candidatus Anammoximicrobium sp.]